MKKIILAALLCLGSISFAHATPSIGKWHAQFWRDDISGGYTENYYCITSGAGFYLIGGMAVGNWFSKGNEFHANVINAQVSPAVATSFELYSINPNSMQGYYMGFNSNGWAGYYTASFDYVGPTC